MPQKRSNMTNPPLDLPLVHQPIIMNREQEADYTLAASITRAASKQTYYTIRFLVDRDRVVDAYRAYAYFRWVDDTLDLSNISLAERLAFVERQQTLMQGRWVCDLMPEERLLMDLIQNRPEPNSGLQLYLQNMMAVMAFDAERRGRLISQQALDDYTRYLATAVTEAMHYFIGHDGYAPCDATRYLAVTGAHITHMLRDTLEDIEAGYFNISNEFVEAHGIDPCEVESELFREWVKCRVQLARECFAAGREYLVRVESWRCRMAGYAYIMRFEVVLDAIEKDGYRLRRDYPERKSLRAAMQMIGAAVFGSLRS